MNTVQIKLTSPSLLAKSPLGRDSMPVRWADGTCNMEVLILEHDARKWSS